MRSKSKLATPFQELEDEQVNVYSGGQNTTRTLWQKRKLIVRLNEEFAPGFTTVFHDGKYSPFISEGWYMSLDSGAEKQITEKRVKSCKSFIFTPDTAR
jgi:hypothetical protein